MDKMKSFLGLENYRIKFSTGEGDYEGTISRIAPEIQLLVITKLIWLPKNLKLGTLTFRAKEIEAFSVIGRSETPQVDVFYPNLYERYCEMPTIFDDEFDNSSSVNESELYSVLESVEEEYIFDVPPFLSNHLPLDNVVIDKLDQDFHCAIQHFQKQDVVGLSLESPKNGRYGNIHWLCISTASCTFLFDIKTLKKLAFDNGLQKILEDPRIEKVIHDCREIADCLIREFDIRLSNIFDTQVADFIINQQRRKGRKIVNDVHSLNSCLAHYLEVPEKYLFFRKKRPYQDDLVFYGLRPLTDDLRNLFIKNVIYLRPLKQKLDVLLMEPLHKCVGVYMKSMRNKTDRELQLESFRDNIVPDELLSERIQVFRFKRHVDIPAVVHSGPPYRKFQDSFEEYVKYCKKHDIANSDILYDDSKEAYKNHCSSFVDDDVKNSHLNDVSCIHS